MAAPVKLPAKSHPRDDALLLGLAVVSEKGVYMAHRYNTAETVLLGTASFALLLILAALGASLFGL